MENMNEEQIAKALNERIDYINDKRKTCIEGALELSINGFLSDTEYNAIANKVKVYYDAQINASRDLARNIVSSLTKTL